MTTLLRRMLLSTAEAAGILAAMRAVKPGPTVLFYHGVEERITDARIQSLHLPIRFFEQQLAYLRKHFEIISLEDLYGSITSGHKLNRRQIVLTFDDGYRNNLTVVEPFLKAQGVPFSVFISTRHVSEGIRLPTYILRTSILYTSRKQAVILGHPYDIRTDSAKRDVLATMLSEIKRAPQVTVSAMLRNLQELLSVDQWDELNERFGSDQPMNWEEVRALREGGVLIGSHCHDHFLLHARQAREDLLAQIRTSRSLIEQQVGECRYIAYPNGKRDDVAQAAVEIAKSEGYLAGLTTVPGQLEPGFDWFMLPRVSAATMDMEHFRYAVSTTH